MAMAEESKAPKQLASVAQVLTELRELRGLVDELVRDSRRARPLLDRYEKLPGWMKQRGSR